MIYRLQAAGVRVPVASNYLDGVLVMELIKDADGNGVIHIKGTGITVTFADGSELWGGARPAGQTRFPDPAANLKPRIL